MREGLGWTELTGRPASDYAGLRWLKTVHPDDQERVRGVWDAALRDGAVAVAEFRVRVVDGGYRWVRARGVPIKEAGAIREWVGTITDVHERKTTEAVVRESEERYRAFIETSATIVWRADPSGAPIEASAVSGPLLEYDGTPEGFEATIHPDDLAASRAAWEHALATGVLSMWSSGNSRRAAAIAGCMSEGRRSEIRMARSENGSESSPTFTSERRRWKPCGRARSAYVLRFRPLALASGTSTCELASGTGRARS
jgi:PAS domain S-box-containing protein